MNRIGRTGWRARLRSPTPAFVAAGIAAASLLVAAVADGAESAEDASGTEVSVRLACLPNPTRDVARPPEAMEGTR